MVYGTVHNVALSQLSYKFMPLKRAVKRHVTSSSGTPMLIMAPTTKPPISPPLTCPVGVIFLMAPPEDFATVEQWLLLLGGRFCFNRQLEHHRVTSSSIAILLGKETALEYLGKCLYTVFIGSSEYLDNYYSPNSSTKKLNPDQYADLLIHHHTSQLKTLYNYGARKIALFGLRHIGCFPSSMVDGLCNQSMNSAVQNSNERLITLVDRTQRGRGSKPLQVYLRQLLWYPRVGYCRDSEGTQPQTRGGLGGGVRPITAQPNSIRHNMG